MGFENRFSRSETRVTPYWVGQEMPTGKAIETVKQETTVYTPYTRRAPRSWAHQMARTLVDITKMAIAFALLIGVASGILHLAVEYIQIPWKVAFGVLSAVLVLAVWFDD